MSIDSSTTTATDQPFEVVFAPPVSSHKSPSIRPQSFDVTLPPPRHAFSQQHFRWPLLRAQQCLFVSWRRSSSQEVILPRFSSQEVVLPRLSSCQSAPAPASTSNRKRRARSDPPDVSVACRASFWSAFCIDFLQPHNNTNCSSSPTQDSITCCNK